MTVVGIYARGGKRAADLFLTIIVLLIASPLLAAIALLAAIKQGRPILFKQVRAGMLGEPITVLKFRTMTGEPDSRSRLTRVTPFGRTLRRTSLDELPQLLNVVRGDMSVVGPRPLHLRYLKRYNDRHRIRNTVRPGLTGLTQVSGRNTLSWKQRLDFDAEYVETLSLRNDVWILIRTACVVSGMGRKNRATEPSDEFFGDVSVSD